MNGTRKIKSIQAIRMGDLLYDEQKRLLILCRSCERHFMTLQSFEKHLTDCSGLKHIVTPADPLIYDEAKRETRLVNGRQELHIYDIEAVKSSSSANISIDWELELEDPRWYTDPKPTVPSPPKAKSKENVVKEYLVQLTEEPPEMEEVPAKRQRSLSVPRRPILTAQQQRRSRISHPSPQPPKAKMKIDSFLVPNVMEDLKRLQESPEKKRKTPSSPEARNASILPAVRTPPAPRTAQLPAAKTSQLPAPRTSQLPSQVASQKPPPRTSQRSVPPVTYQKPAVPTTSQKPTAPEKSQKPPDSIRSQKPAAFTTSPQPVAPISPEKPATPITSPKPAVLSNVTPVLESKPMDGTQKILNKLRACGVDVKRGNTLVNVNAANEQNPTKNQETLDIMRKLQSKGIRCTKVKKT
ncbi:proteoglycan 4 [Drosophila elegans]|uniref:proteoglycan 4 n=1 Tax=Drosophila elegans TaxID=30023 RepID=UPI0007E625F5|nr:proteoglycan 4 [Drosophila elegans]